MVVEAQGPTAGRQLELVIQHVAGTGGEPPGPNHVARPASENLPGPVQSVVGEAITIFIAQVAALVVDLERQRPRIQCGSRVEADDPIGADQRALGIGETEATINLGSQPQNDRTPPFVKREDREVFTQHYLPLVFPPEPAVASSRGHETSDQSMDAGRGFGELEAGDGWE